MSETAKSEQRIKKIIEIAQSRRKEITDDMKKYNKKDQAKPKDYKRQEKEKSQRPGDRKGNNQE